MNWRLELLYDTNSSQRAVDLKCVADLRAFITCFSWNLKFENPLDLITALWLPRTKRGRRTRNIKG